MEQYFIRRKSLRGIVLVMDIRHPMRPFDEQMLDWCGQNGILCHILLTKSDKLKRGPAQATLMQVRKSLGENETIQVYSAKSKAGLNELIEKLDQWYDYDQ